MGGLLLLSQAEIIASDMTNCRNPAAVAGLSLVIGMNRHQKVPVDNWMAVPHWNTATSEHLPPSHLLVVRIFACQVFREEWARLSAMLINSASTDHPVQRNS